MTQRAIIHVDMDAFYASVEQRDDPALRGRPVIVGGTGPRGVVAAASYEARLYGVRSAMPGGRARRLCPNGVFVRVNMSRYREVSRQVFGIFHDVTELVEGLSLDEAFLDVSEAVGGASGPDKEWHRSSRGQRPLPQLQTARRSLPQVEIGREIKRRIAAEVGLTASVGVSHNKMLAKLASDYDKPDGLVYVPPEDVQRFLDPLPVRRLSGVGRQTAARLRELDILTVGQLRRAPPELLVQVLGNRAGELQQLAAGIDHRQVKPSRATKSISQETTFDRDCTTLDELRPVIREQADQVARRLVNKGLYAHTVTVKIRSGGFSTVTRSESFEGYTADADKVAAAAFGLFERWAEMRASFAVRLIGVGVSGLTLDPEPEEIL